MPRPDGPEMPPTPIGIDPSTETAGGIPSRGLLSFCTWRICSSLPPKSFIRWAANALSDADREWYVANETVRRKTAKPMAQSRETDGAGRIPLREAEVWSGFPRSQSGGRDRLRFHARRVSVRFTSSNLVGHLLSDSDF